MGVEVEAKFQVPDEGTFDRLLAVTRVSEYVLGPVEIVEVVDRYYDTQDAALLQGGYACRLRSEGGRSVVTVKGLGGVGGLVHRRSELEVAVEGGIEPRTWPEGPARALVLSLIGKRPMGLLFELRQTRYRRRLRAGDRLIGLFSLDRAVVKEGGRALSWQELEIELEGSGELADLEAVGGLLQREFHLHPQPESKFARALRWHRMVAGEVWGDEEAAS